MRPVRLAESGRAVVTRALPEDWPSACRRVVFVGTRLPAVSGGSTYVLNMSDALTERGIDVEHLTLAPGSSVPRYPTFVVNPRPDLHSAPVLRSRSTRTAQARMLPLAAFKAVDRRWQSRRLRRHFASYGPETAVVFAHIRTKVVLDRSGWRKTDRSPVLVGQHHSQFESIDLYSEAWMRPAMLRHFTDLDAFTALTTEDAQSFASLLATPCHGIGNPAPSRPAPSRPASPRTPTTREPVAVALARYSAEKQLDVMIRCFGAATAERDLAHWRLDLYGEGPMRDGLSELITTSGVGDRVRLAGRADDVFPVLERASVNLLTSSTEGFGMSVLEAATAGVASIVFDCSPGVRELVGATDGYLVPDQDESAYVETLRRALRDPDDLVRRGGRARLGSARYQPAAIVEAWSTLLARAYADRGLG